MKLIFNSDKGRDAFEHTKDSIEIKSNIMYLCGFKIKLGCKNQIKPYNYELGFS